MIEKIKAFFSNKVVQIVEWVVLALAIAGLAIAGIAAQSITSYVALVFAIIAAVSALVSFIIKNLK